MDGIHDLGGMQGFGPVPVRTGDADFRDIKDWEKRMWGISRSRDTLAPGITIDWFRHGIERMVPADYLGFAYFNKWCTNYFMLMLDQGTITMDDVKRGHLDHPDPPAAGMTLHDVLRINRHADVSFETKPLTEPAFAVNQSVRTRRHMPNNHTRLPRYARDRDGTIIAHRGCHALPDEGARGNHVGGHLYTVSFAAAELWGPEANPRDTVTLDLWESYLVPA
jgi:nitrile hydratase subunit beta